MKTASKQSGMTLSEILIAVAVMAILAGVAIPVYSDSRRKAQEHAAATNLKIGQAALERLRVLSRSYENASAVIADLVANTVTAQGHTLFVRSASQNYYELIAQLPDGTVLMLTPGAQDISRHAELPPESLPPAEEGSEDGEDDGGAPGDLPADEAEGDPGGETLPPGDTVPPDPVDSSEEYPDDEEDVPPDEYDPEAAYDGDTMPGDPGDVPPDPPSSDPDYETSPTTETGPTSEGYTPPDMEEPPPPTSEGYTPPDMEEPPPPTSEGYTPPATVPPDTSPSSPAYPEEAEEPYIIYG
jgi:prepilin-type N-terminal cleavage/methylation domain-containing protein